MKVVVTKPALLEAVTELEGKARDMCGGMAENEAEADKLRNQVMVQAWVLKRFIDEQCDMNFSDTYTFIIHDAMEE